MFMEGEVNWTLVLGVLAVAGHVVALVAIWFALANRRRQGRTSGDLDAIRHAAETAERRLLDVLNALPVAVLETDKQGKFVFANRAAHALMGRRDAELLGLRFHSATWGITFPDGRPIPPDLLPAARALRGQTVKGFQHILANPATRRKMLVSVTATPIEDRRGAITGSLSAVVELEGLAQVQAQPVEPPAPAPPDLSRRVFDSSETALVVVAGNGVVEDANPAARRRSGHADLLGVDFADLFLVEDQRIEARQALRAALSAPAGTAAPILARAATPEGRETTWTLSPLRDAEGRVDALLLSGETPEVPSPTPTVEDPSAPVRRALEGALRERDAALAEVERSRAEARAETETLRRLEGVGRLSGGVARDFSAMLAVVTGALESMAENPTEADRVKRLAVAALAAGRKGEAMTRRLSALSDDAGTEALRAMDAGLLLRGMEAGLRQSARGVDLLIEAPFAPAIVRIDPFAFEAAVRALAANAVEAVRAGPAEAASVAIRLEALAEGGARLTVRDTGMGMDRDTLARAPEPFFTTRAGAAGLGLAEVQAFVRQSGGRISLDSRPGEGAEIAVILPPAPAAG